ncbi:MAG: hypothetical protein AAGA54_18985 [Myxococcota bacterium]
MVDTGAAERQAFIVAPEPVDWLAPLVAQLEGAYDVEVFAPWALPDRLPRVARRVGFVRRRLGYAGGRAWFTAAELAARAYARGKAAPTFAARFQLRAMAGYAAAAHLARRRTPAVVIAPSFAARRVFAATPDSRHLLLEDQPDLDGLVDGLDALARQHPQAAFLNNHRPRFTDHVAQRAERWQADAIAVRGRVAAARLADRGPVLRLPTTAPTVDADGGDTVLFAGPLLARGGAMHLPALLRAMPALKIRAQRVDVVEPVSLAEHPRVELSSAPSLQGVAAVLSLGSLESHPRAVARALAAGLPVVGTKASTGALAQGSATWVDPDDGAALQKALHEALHGRAPKPRAWTAAPDIATWAGELSRPQTPARRAAARPAP